MEVKITRKLRRPIIMEKYRADHGLKNQRKLKGVCAPKADDIKLKTIKRDHRLGECRVKAG